MLSDSEFRERRQRLAAQLPDLKVEALLVTHLPNVRYLTGFTGSNGMLLLRQSEAVLFTDPRYTIQARQETSCRVSIARHPILKAAAKHIETKRIYVTGLEKDHISFWTWDYLREKLPPKHRVEAIADAAGELRMVKSDSEIARIRSAVNTNSEAFSRGLKRVKPGMKERDLAAEIDYQMRRLGGDGPSFETIVATGARAALPHARPSSAAIAANQLLLIDMGTTRDGYTSDMTRTVFVGNPQPGWTGKYRAVLDAQLAAIAEIRDGAKVSKVDSAARAVLKSHGLDKTFTHSTGHGLGLEIHEGPRIARKEKTVLKAGMIITVEPGIYLEGEGGIRIEDTVLVTANGSEILTPTTKDLTVL